MTTFNILAQVSYFFHHKRHGATFGHVDTAMIVRTWNANYSHGGGSFNLVQAANLAIPLIISKNDDIFNKDII